MKSILAAIQPNGNCQEGIKIKISYQQNMQNVYNSTAIYPVIQELSLKSATSRVKFTCRLTGFPVRLFRAN